MPHKKLGTLFISTGLLLMAAALFFTMGNLREDRQAGQASAQVIEKFEQVIFHNEPQNAVEISTFTEEIVSQNPVTSEMAVTEIDGNSYIGVLEIPDREIQLPIMSNWSYPQLEISPCRFSGSLYTNDLVICGHNYTSHFGWIWNAGPNEKLDFITVNKEIAHYIVDYVETIGPDDVDYLCEKTDWDLSIFTCTYGNANRRVLRCSRVN